MWVKEQSNCLQAVWSDVKTGLKFITKGQLVLISMKILCFGATNN